MIFGMGNNPTTYISLICCQNLDIHNKIDIYVHKRKKVGVVLQAFLVTVREF